MPSDRSRPRVCKAYFAAYRYLLGDWEPYIYRTDDYGKTWTRLTTGMNGIPADTPTRVIREDPDREGLLYAGTELGMYVSFDDGGHWQPFQLNLPVTPVTDIKVYRNDLVLSTMGRSFWILDNLTPLNQMSDQTVKSGFHLFEPRGAHRMRYGFFRRSPADPEYPPPGVMIDYFLAAVPEDEVTLEISGPEGQVIRTFSSASGQPRLETNMGLHRVRWDMRRERTDAGLDEEEELFRRQRGGPLVAPGTYHAKLIIGTESQTVPCEILIDPRVAADGVTLSDLHAQEQLSLKVLELLKRARDAVARIDTERDRLKPLIERGGEEGRRAQSADARLDEIHKKLVTAEGRYPQPNIIDQIQYLYSMLDRADQEARPGRLSSSGGAHGDRDRVF